MFIIFVYDSEFKNYSPFYFDDLADCFDYLDAVFGHYSEHHPHVKFNFSFCYKPKEVAQDV